MPSIKGNIYVSEKLENKDRRFGACQEYIPALVTEERGAEVPALFTAHELDKAIERAARNPEDIPEDKSFFTKLFG